MVGVMPAANAEIHLGVHRGNRKQQGGGDKN